MLAIAWGDGEQILSFWNSLIIEDNQLSKDFYDRYLTQAEIKPVSEAFHSIGNLGYMLFPATLISPSIIEDKDLYSKSRQIRYLKLLSNIFQNNPENACYSVGLVIKLSNRYDEILPSETPILRSLSDKCKSKSYFQDSQGNQLKTYDDYLSEASKIEDIKLRTIYLLRAAQIALQQSLYVKSIEILESIDDKERKQETWESLREDSAVGLANEYFGAHSLTEMFKVMNALPNELKLQAKVKLIRLIIDEGEYESADLNILLTDAEKENERFLFDNEDSKGYGIILVSPYAKIAEKSKEFPAQSFSVLRQTFQRWNKVYFSTKEKNSSDLKTSESFNVDQKLSPLNIPNYLLEKDFLTASNIIQEINSPIDRVRARLYALKFLLDKQQKLQKQIEDERLNKKDLKVRE